METKTWNIPVAYEVSGVVVVKAETLEAAMAIAADTRSNIPLPVDAKYVDGSWSLAVDDVEEVRSLYNSSQENSNIVYFEVELGEDEDEDGGSNVLFCGKGVAIPTVEEAQAFYQEDCEKFERPVFAVEPIDEALAREEYDFDDVDTWPIFGLPEEDKV